MLELDFVFDDPSYQVMALEDVGRFIDENKHLPWIPGRNQWETEGKPSTGQSVNYLTETVENQAIHILDLHRQIKKLQSQVRELKGRAS